MHCSNPECGRKKPEGFFDRMFHGVEGVIRDNKWYCDEHCFRHPIIKEYLLRKQRKSELHAATWPVTPRSFGAVLIKLGKIDGYQLEAALEEKRNNGGQPLAHYLLKRKLITRRDVIEALGKHHRTPVAYVRSSEFSPRLAEMVPSEVARVGGAAPLSYNPKLNKLSLLMKDPSDLTTIATIRRLTGCDISPYQGDPVEIDRLLDSCYPRAPRPQEHAAETAREYALA